MKKRVILFLVCFCGLLFGLGHVAGIAEEKVKEDKNEVSTHVHENIAVRCDAIKDASGLTLGFRVEVLNTERQKSLVVVVREDICDLFRVDLINEKGFMVSPVLEKKKRSKRGPHTKKPYRYDTIFPQTSHSWFVPLPREIRSDPRKLTNKDNLAPIPKGQYKVEMNVNFIYLFLKKGVEAIPERPKFQQLRLKLPQIDVVADHESLTEDIVKAYIESETGKPEQEEARR